MHGSMCRSSQAVTKRGGLARLPGGMWRGPVAGITFATVRKRIRKLLSRKGPLPWKKKIQEIQERDSFVVQSPPQSGGRGSTDGENKGGLEELTPPVVAAKWQDLRGRLCPKAMLYLVLGNDGRALDSSPASGNAGG